MLSARTTFFFSVGLVLDTVALIFFCRERSSESHTEYFKCLMLCVLGLDVLF